MPAVAEPSQEAGQLFEFGLLEANMGEAEYLPGNIKPVVVRQVANTPRHCHQQAGNGLNLAAEQSTFAGVDAIGHLAGKQF